MEAGTHHPLYPRPFILGAVIWIVHELEAIYSLRRTNKTTLQLESTPPYSIACACGQLGESGSALFIYPLVALGCLGEDSGDYTIMEAFR